MVLHVPDISVGEAIASLMARVSLGFLGIAAGSAAEQSIVWKEYLHVRIDSKEVIETGDVIVVVVRQDCYVHLSKIYSQSLRITLQQLCARTSVEKDSHVSVSDQRGKAPIQGCSMFLAPEIVV